MGAFCTCPQSQLWLKYMNSYSIEVEGIDGSYSVAVFYGSTQVDSESGFRSAKAADKWGETRAIQHHEAVYSPPPFVEKHSRSLHLA